ncbi:MAG TPA: Gfo/Idh/MocA family oxidoreductase [Opitutaceae bacterium]|nr:Gfo/Idh/MocA family oxidoreductase [Opitutaceae bacterium]
MDKIRIGIIGLGNMGQHHARNLLEGKVPRLELAAVCDQVAANVAKFPSAQGFSTPDALFASKICDAVIIATPHFSHTTLGIAALQAGLHVMVEKPISVHRADAERLIAAHRNPQQVFAAMFNQRTDPYYQAIRHLVKSGELGAVRRVQWTITDWFRTDAYYGSGGWRATWAGEGGGVLLNQCPHNLDLFQWIFGMPQKVTGFCTFGRYHHIEVEDDVTAHFEYADGAHGTLITSTGEAPGTNRLEIAAERGRVVYENDKISFLRNAVPMGEFSRTSPEAFGRPATTEVPVPAQGHGGQHNEILQNFAASILDGTPLISPAAEGIFSVELANAILLSAWTTKTVSLPLDGAVYERALQEKIAASKPKTASATKAVVDFSKSVK